MSDIDLSEIVNNTKHYTPADLKGLVCNAQLKAIDRIYGIASPEDEP
jgi:SpoVK/Ycf46/Vps4 family AAA+-type ATPase